MATPDQKGQLGHIYIYTYLLVAIYSHIRCIGCPNPSQGDEAHGEFDNGNQHMIIYFMAFIRGRTINNFVQYVVALALEIDKLSFSHWSLLSSRCLASCHFNVMHLGYALVRQLSISRCINGGFDVCLMEFFWNKLFINSRG